MAVFLVTLVDVLANEDVDLAEGVVAFGLAGAAAGVEVGAVAGVAVAAAGFLVASTFYSSFENTMKQSIKRRRKAYFSFRWSRCCCSWFFTGNRGFFCC